MEGRGFITGYRYGFNGMEHDGELKSNGNSYTTDFRMLDPRLGGRWWSTDPVVKPWESPYAGFANNPIVFSDASGLTPGNQSDNVNSDAGSQKTVTTKDKEGNESTSVYNDELKIWSSKDVDIVDKQEYHWNPSAPQTTEEPKISATTTYGVVATNEKGGHLFGWGDLLPNFRVLQPSGGEGGPPGGEYVRPYNPNSIFGKRKYTMDLSWLEPFLQTNLYGEKNGKSDFYGRKWDSKSNEKGRGEYDDSDPKTEGSVSWEDDDFKTNSLLEKPNADEIMHKLSYDSTRSTMMIQPSGMWIIFKNGRRSDSTPVNPDTLFYKYKIKM